MLTPRVVSNEKATKYLQCHMGMRAAYAVAERWCSWGIWPTMHTTTPHEPVPEMPTQQ